MTKRRERIEKWRKEKKADEEEKQIVFLPPSKKWSLEDDDEEEEEVCGRGGNVLEGDRQMNAMNLLIECLC